jgi:hypothetical protein
MTTSVEPVHSQDSAAQARITAGKPVANLESRRLRLISPPEDGRPEDGREEESEEKGGEEKEGGEKEESGEKNSESSQIETKYEGTNGKPVVSLAPYIQSAKTSVKVPASKGVDGARVNPGIKKRRSRKSGEEDMPPTPLGCEWLRTDDGWNLWRYWSEKDGMTGKRIKKGRYAGYLSNNAWQVMKGYDYETFISIIGQRLRRYGQR